MADIQTMGVNKLRARLKSAMGRLSNIREAAEEAAVRTTVLGGNVIGGGATGWILGRAKRDGKKITIGKSKVRWTTVVNVGLAGIGAFSPRLVGPVLANGLLGLGGGGVGFEAGLWAYEQAQEPST